MTNEKLEQYLEEIGKTPLLEPEEELELLKAVQEKGTDCDEMKQLEKANIRFVVSVANQYQKRGLTLDELIEAGLEGLRKGAMKYSFEADCKFISYAVWWIRQRIIQAIDSVEFRHDSAIQASLTALAAPSLEERKQNG